MIGKQALLDVLLSMAKRVIPDTEDDIVRSILKNIKNIEGNPGGFSFDPRAGRMLNAGAEGGYAMSAVPELTDAITGVNLNRSVKGIPSIDPGTGLPVDLINKAQLEALIRNPYYMDELKSGANLGGFLDTTPNEAGIPLNEFVLDPSRRYLNKNRSIIVGDRAKQIAGFDLGAAEDYTLTPELVEAARKEAMRRFAIGTLGGAGLGAGGYALLKD